MRAFLKSSEGFFQLKSRITTIGSHRGADIVLQSAGVAARHAALEFSASDRSFILQDFNSPQGTFVNSCRVQNAAVRVCCPPLKRHMGWNRQLQAVAEPKPWAPASPLCLPSLQWQLAPSPLGTGAPRAPGRVPHLVLPRRPASARDRSTASATTLDTSASQPASQVMVREGEKLLQKEMGHLFGLETELKEKDVVIRDLQEEITAMTKKLAQAAVRNEAELTQKLLTFNRELGAQTQEIKALREQINDLQKGSNQVFSHSLHKRDLEIGRLRRESEKLKRDQALTAEQAKHELGEQELISCRNRIEELEQDLQGLQKEIQKHQSIQKQLAEKAKAEEELKAAWSRQAEQLQEMGHRELLLRSDVQRAGEQLEAFKSQVMQACSPSHPGRCVTEQQVIEKVRQISDEHQQSHEREKSLQEELSSRLTKEREVSANIEVFKDSLQKLQACLRSPCSSSSLQGELGQLELLCLDPPISAIRTAVVDMARGVLCWLEGAEQLLASTGMDLHTSGKEKSQEMAQSNRMLQEQLEKLQELQAELLQEHTKELEAKHDQDLEIKIQQIILEKDKESRQILESAVTKEKDRYKKSMEEEQKKIQELESHLRSMAEATAKKAEEQELTEEKLTEALHELKKITAQEAVLQQQVLQQDQQLRAVQEENELQKHKLQEEVAGYREQSKQHSLTILALQDRLLEATEQQKVLEEEKAALVEKLEGFQCDAYRSASGAWLEICPAMESHVCLRKLQEELAVAQGTLLEKRAIISRLSRELSETRARMSDMRGELSEEQKVELEHSQRQLKHRQWEVNQLREKLSEMSSLVEQKDQALKAAAEELSQARRRCQVLRDASQQTLESPEDAPRTPVQVDKASRRAGKGKNSQVVAAADGGTVGIVHSVQRVHGDVPQALFLCQVPSVWQQGCVYIELQTGQGSEFFQEPPSDLAELGAMKSNSEPLVVWMKELPEKIVQQRSPELEPPPVLGGKLKAGKVPDHVPNGGSFRISNSPVGMAEVTDLGEKMYLDVIGALGRLMEMKELSGMQPLQHLPQETRAEVGLQRQKALELLYKMIRNLQVCLERKEERLKYYEGSVEQLRAKLPCKGARRRCPSWKMKLTEAGEKALLQEALERMQLDQDKGLQQAAKRHKGWRAAGRGPRRGRCGRRAGRYDAGKDGFIDLMELKLMMEKLGAPQTHLGLKNMIKEVDEDLDSKLSFREFLLIFRKAAAGELQEDSGLHALARLSEIDVSTEGVKGAKNFFEAKAQAINEASRFEEEIKAEQEEKKKQAEELKQRKAAFKELHDRARQDWSAVPRVAALLVPRASHARSSAQAVRHLGCWQDPATGSAQHPPCWQSPVSPSSPSPLAV
ncbi:hypothetical protein Nmel_015924, partial [Mimus melanotis]